VAEGSGGSSGHVLCQAQPVDEFRDAVRQRLEALHLVVLHLHCSRRIVDDKQQIPRTVEANRNLVELAAVRSSIAKNLVTEAEGLGTREDSFEFGESVLESPSIWPNQYDPQSSRIEGRSAVPISRLSAARSSLEFFGTGCH